MKALSVRSPWWWFILYGGKDIENRDWNTRYRGLVYLHASSWYTHRDVVDDIGYARRIVPALAVPTEHPYRWLKSRCGCLVGSVEIVDCVTDSISPWFSGKYGFVLRNPVALADPIPFRGALGFFDIPDSLIGDTA
jgi:hypothetical protein